jgi:cell division protein ZapA
MGQVTVRVGGFSHPVSCEDGQEPHLIALAAEVDRRLDSIRAMGGGGFPEARQILLAALLLADELHDLRTGKVAPTRRWPSGSRASPRRSRRSPTGSRAAEPRQARPLRLCCSSGAARCARHI